MESLSKYNSHRLSEMFQQMKNCLESSKVEYVNEKPVQEFNVDDINEQLGKGNLDILQELDKNQIPYTLAERSNGYTVKYSYKGTNYTIAYYAPQNSGNAVNNDSNTVSGNENSGATEETESPTVSENEDIPEETPAVEQPETDDTQNDVGYEFDFSGIEHLDEPVIDVAEDLEGIERLVTHNLLDTDTLDPVFQEVEKIKPQLKEFIKTKLEEYGCPEEYNEDFTEKYLNYMISEVVEYAYSKSNGAIYHIFDSFGTTTLDKNPTIQDTINYLIDKIDYDLDKYKVHLDITEILNYGGGHVGQEPHFISSNFVESGNYVLKTADYFLTDEEKTLKLAMQIVESASMTTPDKNKVIELLDAYSTHMSWVLETEYNIRFSSARILSNARTYALDNMENHLINGAYSVDDVLQDYIDKCLELADKKSS